MDLNLVPNVDHGDQMFFIGKKIPRSKICGENENEKTPFLRSSGQMSSPYLGRAF